MKKAPKLTRKERNRIGRVSFSSTVTDPIPFNASNADVKGHVQAAIEKIRSSQPGVAGPTVIGQDQRKLGRPRINPRTPAEWQEAVNAAQDALALDSAFQYGLLQWEGGSTESGVKVERCLRLLRAGAKLGYVPEKKPE